MKRFLTVLSICSALLVSADVMAGHHKKGKKTENSDKPSHIDLTLNGKPVLRYMCAFDPSSKESLHDTYKVYAHILDEEGQPITKGAGGKFTHHRGLYIGWAKLQLGGQKFDTWHMKNGVTQQHAEVLEKTDTKLVTKINWMHAKGKILEETRTHEITNDGAYVSVRFTSQLRATEEEIVLAGDPEHAGMQFRPHNDVVQNKSAKYTYHSPEVSAKNVKQTKDTPWVAMAFHLRDQDWSVQHMNHPTNPKGSVYSAYRDYGRFGCFHNKLPIQKGDSLTFTYTIRIVKGKTPSLEALKTAYEALQ